MAAWRNNVRVRGPVAPVGGVKPYTRQYAGAFVRVGPGAPQPSGHAPPAWAPPPIPSAAYNPIRDIELAAGKRGTANTLEDILTRRARGADDFQTSVGGVQEAKANRLADRNTALGHLAESYQRLGVTQGEQANRAGVLSGGALLQAAAKRATNEAKGRTDVQTDYDRAESALQQQLGRLTLGHEREGQDLGTEAERAEREQEQFGIDTNTLKGREAAEAGYIAPEAPGTIHWSRNPRVRARQLAALRRRR